MLKHVLLWAALAAAGCAGGDAFVVVTVSSPGAQLDGLESLHAVFSAKGKTGQEDFTLVDPHRSIPPSLTFGIVVPADVTGEFKVRIEANRGGALVAMGENTITTAAGKRSDVEVMLTGTTASDMLMADMSMPDACVPLTCEVARIGCGMIDPGCGMGMTDCGTCLFTASRPGFGATDDTVFLEGAFGAMTQVTFPGPGNLTATATLLGPNRASVRVPAGATAGPLSVSVSSMVIPQRQFFRRVSFPQGLQPFSTNYAQTDAAKPMSRLATNRRGHAVFTQGLAVTVVGGATLAGLPRNDVEVARLDLDGSLSSFAVDAGKTLINARAGMSYLPVAGYAYVIGGRDVTSVFSSVERAQLNTTGSGLAGTFTVFPTSTLRAARWGAASAIIGKYVYVFGGGTSATQMTATKTVERAEILSDGSLGSFTAAMSPLFTARLGAHAEVVGQKLYIIGGFDGTKMLDTIDVADIGGDGIVGSFTEYANKLDVARGGFSAGRRGDKLILVGGTGATGTDLTSLSFATITGDTLGTFTVSTSILQVPRSAAGVTLAGNELHIIGGGPDSSPSIEHASIDAGMMGTASMDTGRMVGNSRFGMAMAVIGNFLYLFGGDAGANVLTTIARTAIGADGSMGPLMSAGLPTLSTPRAGGQAAVIGNRVCIYGGRTGLGAGLAYADTGECFDIDAANNLVVPTPSPTPAPMFTKRSYFNMVVAGDKLYALGGSNGMGTAANSTEFAPITDARAGTLGAFTTAGAPALNATSLENRMGAFVGNNYYLMGGTNLIGASSSVHGNAATASGLDANFILTGITMTQPRYMGSVARRGAFLIMVGGIAPLPMDMAARGETPDVDVSPIMLNGTAQQLTNFFDASMLVTARRAANLIVLGNFIYVIAGHSGMMPLDTIEGSMLQ